MKSKAQPNLQFTDQQKGTRKMTWVIYRPDEEKLKKSTGKLELNFP